MDYKVDLDKKLKQAQVLSNTLGTGEAQESGGLGQDAISGAAAGNAIVPGYGAALGGALGGVAGALAAKLKRNNANIDADIKEVQTKDTAQQQASTERRATLTGLAYNLSRTLLS